MSAAITILVIEDDDQIRRFLRASLALHGYRLIESATGREGLQLASSHQPDLVILDLGLPDLDGLEVARVLRRHSEIPILVLSARGREREKIAALDAGADDYVTKPFGIGELLARIRVALRHASRRHSDPDVPAYQVGSLRIDFERRRVEVEGVEIHLTPLEYRLLSTLAHHAGKVVTHRQLLKEVWGPAFVDQSHYVRVYMQQLRKKIEAIPARPRFLRTEPGVGYRLMDE